MDEELVNGTPEELKTDLTEIFGRDLVRHRISDLVRYASDASPYRYIPQVIVQPKNIDHVAAIFRYCIREGRHATFRAGGTSLNGQSQGDDILIDVRQHWSGWEVEDNGSRIRCNVGTTLGRINEVLKPYARRMGPDPAGINAATTPKIPVHPACSTTHLGLSETRLEIARALADSAETPLGHTCCGTAGDRGLLHPELVHSATRDTLVQIQSSGEDTCFISANRTCELGMRQTTGKVYESFIYTLEEATRS